MKNKEKIKETYNLLAQEYSDLRKNKEKGGWFYNEYLEMPTTLKMLGNVKKKKILDMGCGPGFYAKILSERGAIVKGIDFSSSLIEIARKEVPEAEFTLGNAEKLPYKSEEFEIVLSALMMDHLKSWDKALKEVKRVLKKRGLFVFSIKNPVTICLQKKKWFFKTFREIDRYFDEDWRIAKWKGKRVSGEGAHHHKTYGTIIKYLVKYGFEIIDCEDTKPLSSAKNIFPREYQKTVNSPHFCTWKTVKK